MNENTIIKTVPAAGALRKVPGFDPLKHLRTTTSHKTGEKVLKLDLPFKRLWFRLACPNGRMLLKPLRITDQMAIFEAKVFLSKDDPTPISNFTSTQMAKDVPGGLYIRAAQDEALNEALDNAGFGIQLCDVIQVSDGSRYGSEIPLSQLEAVQKASQQGQPAANTPSAQMVTTEPPVQTAVNDAPPIQTAAPIVPAEPVAAPAATEPVIAVEPAATETAEPMPAPVQMEQEPVERLAMAADMAGQEPAAAEQPHAVVTELPQQDAAPALEQMAGNAPAAPVTEVSVGEVCQGEIAEDEPTAVGYTADMTVEEICERMTLDEARGIVVDIGTCKGWTLGEVSERRAPSLKFYVRGCSDANNVLKAAASLLLTDLEQRKAG